MDKMNNNTRWITRSAALTALLVTAQFTTAGFGNQYLTGSIVNLILAVSAISSGLAVGLTVAVISPVCAFLVGAGPGFPALIPFIMLGNTTYILAWNILKRLGKNEETGTERKLIYYSAPMAAALVKFLTLYVGVVFIAAPYLLELNEKQSAMITRMFSYPQFINALIGGIVAQIVNKYIMVKN